MTYVYSILFAAGLIASSCTPVSDQHLAEDQAADLSVDFFNATNFDQKMSSALYAHPQTVTVNLLAPTTLNTIPERLGSWLTMVEKNKGTVQLQDDSAVRTRAFIDPVSFVIAGIMIYKAIQDRIVYHPVAAYNATIHYEDGGKVSKVVFTRKESSPTNP